MRHIFKVLSLVLVAIVLAACGSEVSQTELGAAAGPRSPTRAVLNSAGFIKDSDTGFKLNLNETPRSVVEAEWGVGSDADPKYYATYSLPNEYHVCVDNFPSGRVFLRYTRADGSEIPTYYDSDRGRTVGDPLPDDVVTYVSVSTNYCFEETGNIGGYPESAANFKVGKGFTIEQIAENPDLVYENFSGAKDISDGTSRDVYIDFGNGLFFSSDKVVYGPRRNTLILDK